jgi:hypothetical protein
MSGLAREAFEALWERLDEEAEAAKFSHEALLRLTDFYRRLDDKDDRRVIDETLASWVLEGDERHRFDALAVIHEFHVRSALPALEAELARLDDAVGPSAPTDRAKLERIIADLR